MATDADRILALLHVVIWRCGQSDVTIATDIIDGLMHLSAASRLEGDEASGEWFEKVCETLIVRAPADLQDAMRADLDRRGIPI